jgi:hypothetical protein
VNRFPSRAGLAFFFAATLFSFPVFACQVECVVFATSSKQARLIDGDGKALAKAEVVIRDASKKANGPQCFCGRFGPIVSHLWTDENGRLSLDELQPGEYWLTYMDPQAGESFYVSIERGKSKRTPFELQIDHFANRCYLVDVERNETKPIGGWPKPVSQTDAEKN